MSAHARARTLGSAIRAHACAAAASRRWHTRPAERGITGTAQMAVSTARGSALYRALVFDCDGVLVDSERHSCLALADAMRVAAGIDVPREVRRSRRPPVIASEHAAPCAMICLRARAHVLVARAALLRPSAPRRALTEANALGATVSARLCAALR